MSVQGSNPDVNLIAIVTGYNAGITRHTCVFLKKNTSIKLCVSETTSGVFYIMNTLNSYTEVAVLPLINSNGTTIEEKNSTTDTYSEFTQQ